VSEADELRESRARLASSAGAERRRIERALHDGAQQDLIALSVQLQLLRDALTTDPRAALELVDALSSETHAALERVRDLSDSVYPAVLDARGLADALRSAATAKAVVDADSVERQAPETERAVFFACRAAIDGAEPDAQLTIRLRERGGSLQLELVGASSGLTAARDLLEAAGGVVMTAGPARLSATI
jgi:signal transduction histidine kinase